MAQFKVTLALFTNPSITEDVIVEANDALSACSVAERGKEGYLGVESNIIESKNNE